MPGLFGTLNLGMRALQAQQTAVEVAGQNLANVNNRAYARQRVELQTSPATPTAVGPQGTGVEVAAIQQIRDTLLDGQVRTELSVGGFWEAKQSSLQSAQTGLGEVFDRAADSAGTSAATSAGATAGLADDLTGLFNAFQDVAIEPTSLANRQLLVSQAQTLATRFNQAAERLDDLNASLNTALSADVTAANQLLTSIAGLNDRIADAEFGGGAANDLRDLREQKLEALSKLVNIETGTTAKGSLSVSIGGVTLVSGRDVLDTLQTFDAGGGQLQVRATTAGTPLGLTGGTMQGRMDVRDGLLQTLRDDLDSLASNLITEVNSIHRTGYSLTGSTGADFFTGTDAASLSVDTALADDPSLIQAAGTPGAVGDNTVALTLARLADRSITGLGNRPFQSAYGQVVANLGNGLADANSQLANHEAVKTLLLGQRDSVSGVSLDEEMSDLIRFQKAYQASARIVSVVDEMLDTVLSLKR
jgi:flagellar hook-associated protein 1 FlgK